MVTIDPTINVGHILELVIVITGAIGVGYKMHYDSLRTREDIKELRVDVEKIADVLTTLARQDERLKSLERFQGLKRS